MNYRGPRFPGQRTSRTQAEDIGVDEGNLRDEVPLPLRGPFPKDNVPEVLDVPARLPAPPDKQPIAGGGQ